MRRKKQVIRKNKMIKTKRKRRIRKTIDWTKLAYIEGQQQGNHHRMSDENHQHKFVNRLWTEWILSNRVNVSKNNGRQYHEAAASFLAGYGNAVGIQQKDWVLVPTTQSIGAIVSVMNEEKTILSILNQLQRLPLDEIIFVVNGSKDLSFHLIRNHSDSVIIHYPHPIGHDVGRAIGAKLANSDILLFMDGDFPVFAEHLVPFIDAVERGLDVALNDISPYIGLFSGRDAVTMIKQFLNRSLSRPDLGANSLTAVPHALSKKAVQSITYTKLMVPPIAQAAAILNGLNIGAPMSVDVITKNRLRADNMGTDNSVSEMIIGDHVEALNIVMEVRGARMLFEDSIRQRMKVGVDVD
jgi:hypothetical protein